VLYVSAMNKWHLKLKTGYCLHNETGINLTKYVQDLDAENHKTVE